ncbi:MAG: class II aldolase/adducin family protein [Burkholderiaceae bacterium]
MSHGPESGLDCAVPPGAGTGGCAPELATEQAARRAVVATCRETIARGLNTGRAGNVSLRWHRGGRQGDGMLISPAALACDALTADDIVWLALAADEAADGKVTDDGAAADEAGRRPSSEWRMHRDLYRSRPDAGAVIHVHSPAATALACLPRVQRDGIPAFHYMVAVAGGADIRCAPYRTFGTPELSEVAAAALRDRRACLLANHGTLAFAATLAGALELSCELESLARMYAQILATGEPSILPGDEIERVLARFADYRQAG